MKGWYTQNPQWKRNTLFVGAAVFMGAIFVLKQSWNYERRPCPGVRPVLSERFAKHTLVDNPEYYEKVEYYKKNGKSLRQRLFPTKEDMEE